MRSKRLFGNKVLYFQHSPPYTSLDTVSASKRLAPPFSTAPVYGIGLAEALPQGPFDMVLLAVPHQAYLDLGDEALRGLLTEGGTLADLKGVLNGSADWTL